MTKPLLVVSGIGILACLFAAQRASQEATHPGRVVLETVSGETVAYQVDEAWPQRPDDFEWADMPGIDVDAEDNVWTFTRAEPPVQVYATDGTLVRAWGEGQVGSAHHIRVGPDGNIWLADIGLHVVRQYTPEGELLLTLGTPGEAGTDDAHFDQPTDMAVTPQGHVFVSDGYGNSRVVHFDGDGNYVGQWGTRGAAPGEFNLPHSIAVDSAGRLYVADRSNARVQVFDQQGRFLAQWRGVVVPWHVWVGPDDAIWVCGSSVPEEPTGEMPGIPPHDQIIVQFDTEGRVVARMEVPLGEEGNELPGELNWVHAVAFDSEGNFYAGDIMGRRAQRYVRLADRSNSEARDEADADAVEDDRAGAAGSPGGNDPAPYTRTGAFDAPERVHVREVLCFEAGDDHPVRVAPHPGGRLLYVLCTNGDVWLVDPETGSRTRVLVGDEYIEQPPRDDVNIRLFVDRDLVNANIVLRATLAMGLHADADGRLYLVANVLYEEPIHRNHIVVYRARDRDGDAVPDEVEQWTSFDHPYGVGGFNHGASRIAEGPDRMIYLAVGSRTDHGEAGTEAYLDHNGETELTAAILRFDPNETRPSPYVFARGLRNPFGFDWDDHGRLFAVEHGPNADHAEELNWVQEGRHYGFPYRFANDELPDYEDRAAAPDGLTFELPVRNLGPDGLLAVHPLWSFAPHSGMGGMCFYSAGELPEEYHRTFFVCRFGNLLGYNRVGFDVLNVRIESQGHSANSRSLTAHTRRFISGLGRPIDVCTQAGRLYIVEYCRQRETAGPNAAGYELPGRLLEVGAAP